MPSIRYIIHCIKRSVLCDLKLFDQDFLVYLEIQLKLALIGLDVKTYLIDADVLRLSTSQKTFAISSVTQGSESFSLQVFLCSDQVRV